MGAVGLVSARSSSRSWTLGRFKDVCRNARSTRIKLHDIRIIREITFRNNPCAVLANDQEAVRRLHIVKMARQAAPRALLGGRQATAFPKKGNVGEYGNG